MNQERSANARLSWAQLVGMALFSGMALLLIQAQNLPVQGQETPKNKKAVTKAKAPAKKTAPSTGSIPGAGQKLDSKALAKIIDQEVNRVMASEGLKPSGQSSDAEFLRRVYLDLTGVIPTSDKVTAFLESKDSNKREKVVEELLASPRFGQFLAEIWSGLMLPRESNNRKLNHTPFQEWLAGSFNKNVPLDQIVYDIVTSTGDQDKNGAVTFYVANPTVDKMTDNVTRMFLGVQLQCAQCHNHPFTDWKQKEYWGMAQFFMKVKLTANPNQAAKKGVAPGITESNVAKGKKGALPESAMKVSAKFLAGEEPPLNASEPYRPILGKWMTSPNNSFFAKAMVNRFWYQIFGRGLVNPVDDMHDNNEPSHPELLEALTQQFKANGFDVKYLVRAMVLSDAYQRSSVPVGDNATDNQFYSHRIIRMMYPEQLYDSLAAVVGKAGKGDNTGAAQKKGGAVGPRDNFLTFFRIEDGYDPLEYQNGIPQALRLMNSAQGNSTQGSVSQAIKTAGNDPAKVVEQLYLIGLSRRPTAEEQARMVEYVSKNGGAQAYNDVLWALINSSEFMLNH